MKQLKSIEILKAITENEGTHLWLDDGSGYPKSYIYEAIEELEEYIKEDSQDRLAELEKAIIDYYLAEGYKFDLFGSRFQINISTFQNQKEIQILIKKDFNSNYETVFRIIHNTTKEMFDAAFENFSTKELK